MDQEPTDSDVIDCWNPRNPSQRVVVDLEEDTVPSCNCHEPRKFTAIGMEPTRVCGFDEIHAVHDFMTGDHSGWAYRIIFMLGHLIYMPVKDSEMSSIFISTAYGRARIFANWEEFDSLCDGLRHNSSASGVGHWSDNPRLIPVYAVVLVVILTGLIWLLL